MAKTTATGRGLEIHVGAGRLDERIRFRHGRIDSSFDPAARPAVGIAQARPLLVSVVTQTWPNVVLNGNSIDGFVSALPSCCPTCESYLR